MLNQKRGRPPRDLFHNPIAKWAKGNGLTIKEAALILDIPYASLRMLTSNARGISWERALQIEKKTKGRLEAKLLMEWYRRNRRGREGNNLIPRTN